MDTATLLIIYGACFLVFLIGMYYFLRFVFNLKRILWNQQATIKLLLILAEKQAGNTDEIATIKELNNRDTDV